MPVTKESAVEALGRAHRVLLADLQELEEAVRPSSGEDLASLRHRLMTAQTHIRKHFQFEEQNGYMDVVKKREPRLARTIQQLAEEHGQLRQSLESLLGEVASAATLADRLREKTSEWVQHVRQHELRENDLVQDAFNMDIGAED